MAYSRIQIPGNGTNGPFVVSFALGYLSQSEVTCRVNEEVDGLGAPVYRTITWLDVELVNISGAAPGVLDVITFERTVDKETLKHDFADGAPMIERNLDDSHKQALMAVHEALDGRFGALQSDLDAGNHNIINVLDPVDAQDAATKAYVDLQVFSSGNVIAPTAPDVGKVLTATGVGTWGWASPVVVPAATETVAGIGEIATDAEVTTGTDNTNKFLNVLKAVTAFARKAVTNTFTAVQSFHGTGVNAEPVVVIGTDAGLGAGPFISTRRDLVTPAVGNGGGWKGYHKDSGGALQAVVALFSNCSAITAGAMSATIQFWTTQAGTFAKRWDLGFGLFSSGVTGGDKGIGTINAHGVYVQGQPVGGGLSVFTYETTSGTNAQATVATAWTQAPFNTAILNNAGVAVASNQFTLTAGTYRIRLSKVFYASGFCVCRLRNITDGTDIAFSTSVQMGISGLTLPCIIPEHELTIASTKVIEVQYHAESAHAQGQGNAAGDPATVNNKWAIITFEKIA